MLGQAQECLASGIIVSQVPIVVSVRARKLAVVVEHVGRAHRLGELSPRTGWHRALVYHRPDDEALPRVVGDRHSVAVVYSRDARPRVDDALSSQDFLDERGVGAFADRAEGDGLEPHASSSAQDLDASD